MTLLFIRQQGNGPERNANLIPEGFSRGEASADGPPSGKRLSYSLRPVFEDATDEKEKTMNGFTP